MTRSVLRSFAGLLIAAVVVASAASLLGCASYGPATRVAVPDVKSLTGTWKGTVYRSGFEPESVALAIHEDGSYDVVLVGSSGTSRGSGKILVSDGRLLVEGAKGRGAGTLLRNPAGDVVLNVDMILNDNSTLTAKLWRSP
jgi:hypothetical protein